MSYQEVLLSITLDADASVVVFTGVPGTPGSAEPNSGKQYRFVKVTGVHICGLASAAANERVIGVIQSKPQVLGQACTVAVGGISQVEFGATVTAGDGVKVDATGRPITWVAGTDADSLRVGVAITSGAVGQLGSVLLRTI